MDQLLNINNVIVRKIYPISEVISEVTSIRYFFFFFLLLLHSPILTKPNIMPNTIPLWSNLTPLLQRFHVTGEPIIVKCNLISLENDFVRKNIFQQDIQNFLPESNYLMFSFKYPHGIYNVILFYKKYKNIRKLTSYSHWINIIQSKIFTPNRQETQKTKVVICFKLVLLSGTVLTVTSIK